MRYRPIDEKEGPVADIRRFLFIQRLRSQPTAYVRHQRNGRVVHDGAGLSFWFRAGTAAISEVPVDDREQPLLFHGRSLGFEDVTVQATVAFRVVDPAAA